MFILLGGLKNPAETHGSDKPCRSSFHSAFVERGQERLLFEAADYMRSTEPAHELYESRLLHGAAMPIQSQQQWPNKRQVFGDDPGEVPMEDPEQLDDAVDGRVAVDGGDKRDDQAVGLGETPAKGRCW